MYVVLVKKYSSFKVGGTQLQKSYRNGTQKAKGWEPLIYAITDVIFFILGCDIFENKNVRFDAISIAIPAVQ